MAVHLSKCETMEKRYCQSAREHKSIRVKKMLQKQEEQKNLPRKCRIQVIAKARKRV